MTQPVRRTLLVLSTSLVLAICPCTASATWSIVAVDPETGEVGMAAASCILGTENIMALVPGRAAFAAQAMSGDRERQKGIALLETGARAQAVVDALATSASDSWLWIPTYPLRQYGVATLDLEGSTASFTGDFTFDWSGARSAAHVSVQGNSLYGQEVVERALEAFNRAAPKCENRLADRLMRALEAGAAQGGDQRCAPALAALSAFLAVALPDDPAAKPYLRLVASRPGEPPYSLANELLRLFVRPEPGEASENPVSLLRDQYDSWRANATSVRDDACP